MDKGTAIPSSDSRGILYAHIDLAEFRREKPSNGGRTTDQAAELVRELTPWREAAPQVLPFFVIIFIPSPTEDSVNERFSQN
jgi:hypothetical protein